MKKTVLFGLLCAFIVAGISAAGEKNGDDIFTEMKPEKNDFYSITIEPTKQELRNAVKAQMDNIKAVRMEHIKKVEEQKRNISSVQKEYKKDSLSASEQLKRDLEEQRKSIYRSSGKKQPKKAAPAPAKTASAKPEPSKTAPAAKAALPPESSAKTAPAPAKTAPEKPESSKTAPAAKAALPPESSAKTTPAPAKTAPAKPEPSKKAPAAKAVLPPESSAKIAETEKRIDSAIAQRQKFIDYSMGLQGTKYVYGGKTPNPGIDCSGLITYSAKQSLDIDLTGNAQMIYDKTTPIPIEEAAPGDLVFFKSSPFSRVSHVGIFLGKNEGKNDFGNQNLFLNAASSGSRTGVIVSGLDENYWKRTYYGCGRFLKSIE